MSNTPEIQATIFEHDLRSALSSIKEVVRSDWAAIVSESDPRFTDVMPSGYGTFEERFAWLAESPADNATEIVELSNSIASIIERTLEIAETPLLAAFRELIQKLSGVSGPMLDGLIFRLGLGGRPPATLQAAGDIAGRTRERIRQIEARILSRKPIHPIFMPRLSELVIALGRYLPLSINKAENVAIDLGLTQTKIHPASVIAMADFCGIPVDTWNLYKVGGKERLAVKSDRDHRPLMRLAAALCDSSGVSSVYILAEELGSTDESEFTEIIDLLSGYSNMEFLEGPWFWNPDGARNRLRNITRKILSVTRDVSLGDLRAGIERAYRWRNLSAGLRYELIVPPISVLSRFYSVHPEFELELQDRVRPVDELNYRDELGPTEQTFVDVLRSIPSGVIERKSFADACMKLGMNENTFNVYTSYSPVLEHVDVDVWALRGARIDLTAIRAVQLANSARPREQRVVDAGWTPEGNYQIAARLPKLMENFVLGIPAGFHDYLTENSYPASDGYGRSCGSIGISNDSILYGFGTFLRRSGADENDILSIEFSLVTRTVTLSLKASDEQIDFGD